MQEELDYATFKRLLNEGNLKQIIKYPHNQDFLDRFTREKLEECEKVVDETLTQRDKDFYAELKDKGLVTD